MADSAADTANRGALREIGTLHDARHVIFDNGTQHMFASVFDGSWDTYIDDFGKTVIGANFDRVFSHAEGFPGISDPGVKDWFVAHQAPAGSFVSSYPDLTVQQIWKDQRVNEAFQEVLDTPSSGRRWTTRPMRSCWPRLPSRSCWTKPRARTRTQPTIRADPTSVDRVGRRGPALRGCPGTGRCGGTSKA